MEEEQEEMVETVEQWKYIMLIFSIKEKYMLMEEKVEMVEMVETVIIYIME